MPKIVYSSIISLDGFESNTFFAPAEDSHAYFNRLFEASDAVIFDRENHELLVPYWDDVDLDDPDLNPVEREFARIFRTKPRHVKVRGNRPLEPLATALEGDVASAITALREQPGNQLLLASGPEMFDVCLTHGLVDEIEVVIVPIMIGKGNPAFGAIGRARHLRLLSTSTFTSGEILAKYAVT